MSLGEKLRQGEADTTRYNRRGLGKRASLLTLPLSLENVFAQEQEGTSPTPGSLVRDISGRVFWVKEELYDDKRMVVRRSVPNPVFSFPGFYYSGTTYLPDSTLASITFIENRSATTVPFWTGEEKRYNAEGGIKIVPIPGVNSKFKDNTFSPILQRLMEGRLIDEKDILHPTYKIDPSSLLLGLLYSEIDSTQSPEKSIVNMDTLMHLWKKQFPLDKFWFLGHSQGGKIALELALRHPDVTAGVITFNGALMGAESAILPPLIETPASRLLLGEAGEFFVRLANDPVTPGVVKEQVASLVVKRIPVATFASTDDLVVSAKYALVPEGLTPLRSIFPIGFDLAYPMGSWRYWDTAQEIERDPLQPDFSPSVIDSESARIRNADHIGTHGAVLQEERVLRAIPSILATSHPQTWLGRLNSLNASELAELRRLQTESPASFLFRVAPPGRKREEKESFMTRYHHYHLSSDVERVEIVLRDRSDTTRDSAISWVRSFGVSEKSFPLSFVFS